jgi:hypothetical protein
MALSNTVHSVPSSCASILSGSTEEPGEPSLNPTNSPSSRAQLAEIDPGQKGVLEGHVLEEGVVQRRSDHLGVPEPHPTQAGAGQI